MRQWIFGIWIKFKLFGEDVTITGFQAKNRDLRKVDVVKTFASTKGFLRIDKNRHEHTAICKLLSEVLRRNESIRKADTSNLRNITYQLFPLYMTDRELKCFDRVDNGIFPPSTCYVSMTSV
jgi:hypothetical protein